eukprot:TRINITY_DN104272_c0_g1_i1.p2 TRINITY_DN104272_c0_g1~~TRINITY_DN104272_c0_g1_i1.p2  ORF type:complete len:161 (-),score=29.51 TRINITY_DN104272_c0_g1_i1:80-562(-)
MGKLAKKRPAAKATSVSKRPAAAKQAAPAASKSSRRAWFLTIEKQELCGDCSSRNWNRPDVRDAVMLSRRCASREACLNLIEKEFGHGFEDPYNGKNFGMPLKEALKRRKWTLDGECVERSAQITANTPWNFQVVAKLHDGQNFCFRWQATAVLALSALE